MKARVGEEKRETDSTLIDIYHLCGCVCFWISARTFQCQCQGPFKSTKRPREAKESKCKATERATAPHKSQTFFLSFPLTLSLLCIPSFYSTSFLYLSATLPFSLSLCTIFVLSLLASFSSSLLAGVDLATLHWSHARVLSAWPLGPGSTL